MDAAGPTDAVASAASEPATNMLTDEQPGHANDHAASMIQDSSIQSESIGTQTMQDQQPPGQQKAKFAGRSTRGRGRGRGPGVLGRQPGGRSRGRQRVSLE